jgi:hypothetical protein
MYSYEAYYRIRKKNKKKEGREKEKKREGERISFYLL